MAEIYGQRIQTTVNTKYLPFAVDTILNSNPVFQRTVRAADGGDWSGRTLRAPIKVSKNTTATSFRGFDTFSTAATDNRQFLEYTPSFHQITVALPGDELSVADTEDKVLNLMKLTIQSDAEDLADALGDAFYADGTGNSSKDVLGLGALVDDGTNVATIGGLNRNTFTTLQSTVTASSGTLTLAKMDTLWNAVTSGAQVPTIAPTTETVFSLYGQLLRPQERIVKEMGVGPMRSTTGFAKGSKEGMRGLDFNGMPVVADEKCPSGLLIFLNERYNLWSPLKAFGGQPVQYKSQIEGNDYDAPVGLGFTWSDWIKAQNAHSFVGHIFFAGQYYTNNPKRSGKLTGITGI